MQTHLHRVRGAEVDNQSYVFNTRYLEITDAALTEYLRGLGFTLAGLLEQGFDPSVVKVTAEYSAPGRLDDLLEVDTSCTRVGRSSFDMHFSIRCGERVLVSVDTVYVNVDAVKDRAVALPEELATALRFDMESTGAEAVHE